MTGGPPAGGDAAGDAASAAGAADADADLRLVPVPPHAGDAPTVARTPFWIGAGADAGLALHLPGIATRHVALVRRADGWWASPPRPAPPGLRLAGEPLTEPRRLAPGVVLELVPGIAYRVGRPGAPAPRPAAAPATDRAPAAVPAAPAAPSSWWRRLGRGLRRGLRRGPRRGLRRRPHARGWLRETLVAALLVLAAGSVVAAGVLLVRALRPPPAVPPPLTEAESEAYDRLADAVAERTERGAALLELGFRDAALREFGAAVAELETSPLRDNAWVRPRIAALESGIAAIYRERGVVVPARYARAARGAPRATPAALERTPRLTVAAFDARLDEARAAFAARFGRELVVTGRDHAEHVALYGTGGAVDLRVRDLTREQVAWLIATLRAGGVRVKDFSTDAVLRAQIAAARAAGLPDRAGTGLHLHADRFTDRRDAWTVE